MILKHGIAFDCIVKIPIPSPAFFVGENSHVSQGKNMNKNSIYKGYEEINLVYIRLCVNPGRFIVLHSK